VGTLLRPPPAAPEVRLLLLRPGTHRLVPEAISAWSLLHFCYQGRIIRLAVKEKKQKIFLQVLLILDNIRTGSSRAALKTYKLFLIFWSLHIDTVCERTVLLPPLSE
jgi:hypothetical protein